MRASGCSAQKKAETAKREVVVRQNWQNWRNANGRNVWKGLKINNGNVKKKAGMVEGTLGKYESAETEEWKENGGNGRIDLLKRNRMSIPGIPKKRRRGKLCVSTRTCKFENIREYFSLRLSKNESSIIRNA